ncbi:MAG: 4-hydroxy-tetrahydrodipicolinate synthase [Spirochaetes bacterium]|nr:MAG: 4-hydroxy-tetrahydrodipicolinate synthase [Spirochaetota bacterium]
MVLEGVYTALITPFNKDESIDEPALREIVDYQINEGISGLVPMGTTGESPTLSHEEHIRAIEIVIDQANGRVPVIAGTGSNATSEALELTTQAMECGADASLQVAPYYNKPTQEGFYRHFMKIADTVDIPLIIYNIPGRTGKNIENETMLRMAKHPNIVGVKEASGNIDQMMNLIMNKPDDFTVLSGDDNMTFPLIALGGRGVVSVASNYIPSLMVKFVSSMLGNKLEEARVWHYRLLPFFKACFIETNPIPIKYAMVKKGFAKEIYRLPMCPMSDENKKKFEKILESVDSIKA